MVYLEAKGACSQEICKCRHVMCLWIDKLLFEQEFCTGLQCKSRLSQTIKLSRITTQDVHAHLCMQMTIAWDLIRWVTPNLGYGSFTVFVFFNPLDVRWRLDICVNFSTCFLLPSNSYHIYVLHQVSCIPCLVEAQLMGQVLECSYSWITSHSFFCFQPQWSHILQSQILLYITTALLLARYVKYILVFSLAQVVHHYYLTVTLVVQNLTPVKSLHGTERSTLFSLSNQLKWGKWICSSTTFHQVELDCLLLSSSGVISIL